MTDEIKKLLPGEEYTTLSGEKLTISPVPFGKMRIYQDAINKLFQAAMSGGVTLEGESMDYAGMLSAAFEEVMALLGLILDRPRDWFDSAIDFADGCALLEIVVRQNFDNDRAKKNLSSLLQRANSLLQTLSPSSSAKATASQK